MKTTIRVELSPVFRIFILLAINTITEYFKHNGGERLGFTCCLFPPLRFNRLSLLLKEEKAMLKDEL